MFKFTIPFFSCRLRYIIKHPAFDFLVWLIHCQKLFCFFQILNCEYHQQQTLACEHDTLERAASLFTRAPHLEHLCVMSVTDHQISNQVNGCDWLYLWLHVWIEPNFAFRNRSNLTICRNDVCLFLIISSSKINTVKLSDLIACEMCWVYSDVRPVWQREVKKESLFCLKH
jgi:hypothetical protein